MRARPAVILVLMSLATGCGALLPEPQQNRCQLDDDCAVGSCDTELGMCVTTPAEPIRVMLEVAPASDPFDGTPLVTALPDVLDVRAPTSAHDVQVPFAVRVFGRVHWRGDLIGAEITFAAVDDVRSCTQALRASTRTLSEATTFADGMAGNYAIQILPGRRYELTVEPNGAWRAELPILRMPVLAPMETCEGQCAVRLDVAYEDEPWTLQGVVRDPVRGQPEAGLFVRGVDAATGRVISSVATTDAGGSFTLRFAPGWNGDRTDWLLQLNATPERAMGDPVPVFSVAPQALVYDASRKVTVQMPAVPDVLTYRALVEAALPGARARPVAGATALFSASRIEDPATGVVGSFQTMATTDANGELVVRLLPGTYDVVITPIDRDVGVLHEQRDLHLSASGQIFQLPPRASLSGTLQTPEGERVAGARVRADARGGDNQGLLPISAAYARSSETQSDATGLFDLRLDVGVYDVVVEPPASSRYPWRLERDVVIGGSSAPVLPLELSPPVPLGGMARWPDGTPLAGAEVRACAIVGRDGAERLVAIGRATTDGEGRYTLLLPPRP